MQTAVLAVGAIGAFHAAYLWSAGPFLMGIYLACLFLLGRVATARQAFWLGMGLGLAIYAPHLAFFWVIFGPAAASLWGVLAFWIAAFLLVHRAARRRLGPLWSALLAPFLWLGLEYFRSELYPLRFSWLSVGFAFSDSPQLATFARLGVYGIGFALMAAVAVVAMLPRWAAVGAGVLGLGVLAWFANLPASNDSPPAGTAAIRVAGMQMEFPAELEVPLSLDLLKRTQPDAELLALSEYTFSETLPARVRDWCRKNSRHLIVGAKDVLDPKKFYNTAFVVGPDGNVVFQQAKSVPIQFMNDGLPAPEQKVWKSPWGRLGLAVCYDLSYTRVMDRLVKLGAQALVIPTMDVTQWGAYEHRLHARVAPMRAAEHGLAILRVTSSGISQLVDGRGTVRGFVPFPGEKAILAGDLPLAQIGRLPFDRHLAPVSVGITGFVIVALAIQTLAGRRKAASLDPS